MNNNTKTLSESIQNALSKIESMLSSEKRVPVKSGIRSSLDILRSELLQHYLTSAQPVVQVPGQQAIPYQDPAMAQQPVHASQVMMPQPVQKDLPVMWKRALERGRQEVQALIEQLMLEGNHGEADRLGVIAASWMASGNLKMDAPAPVYDKTGIVNRDDLEDPRVAPDGMRTDSAPGT